MSGLILKKWRHKAVTLETLVGGISITVGIGLYLNTNVLDGISLNDMLMGVSFSTTFCNRIEEEYRERILRDFSPILGISLLAAIVDLGAPLDYHRILGAGLYTFLYIAARAFGKYFGGKSRRDLDTYVGYGQKVSWSDLAAPFGGIACFHSHCPLSSQTALVEIVQGTIAAAAVLNEIIAVIAAKKGFEWAGEIRG